MILKRFWVRFESGRRQITLISFVLVSTLSFFNLIWPPFHEVLSKKKKKRRFWHGTLKIKSNGNEVYFLIKSNGLLFLVWFASGKMKCIFNGNEALLMIVDSNFNFAASYKQLRKMVWCCPLLIFVLPIPLTPRIYISIFWQVHCFHILISIINVDQFEALSME